MATPSTFSAERTPDERNVALRVRDTEQRTPVAHSLAFRPRRSRFWALLDVHVHTRLA